MKFFSHISIFRNKADDIEEWNVRGHRHQKQGKRLTCICGAFSKQKKLTLQRPGITFTILSSGLIDLEVQGEQHVLYEGRIVHFANDVVAWMPPKKSIVIILAPAFSLMLCVHNTSMAC